MKVTLTEEEIDTLKKQVSNEATEEQFLEVSDYETLQDMIDKAQEVIKIHPSLTLSGFTFTSTAYHSYEDVFSNIECSYEIPLTKEKHLSILKQDALERKQREYDSYIRALEIVKEYEEKQ